MRESNSPPDGQPPSHRVWSPWASPDYFILRVCYFSKFR